MYDIWKIQRNGKKQNIACISQPEIITEITDNTWVYFLALVCFLGMYHVYMCILYRNGTLYIVLTSYFLNIILWTFYHVFL